MRKSFEREMEDIVENYLEDNSFEDLLEQFNITPTELFILAYESGLIDDDILERIKTIEY